MALNTIKRLIQQHKSYKLYTQSDPRTPDPKIKSHMLCGLSQPGAPSTVYLLTFAIFFQGKILI